MRLDERGEGLYIDTLRYRKHVPPFRRSRSGEGLNKSIDWNREEKDGPDTIARELDKPLIDRSNHGSFRKLSMKSPTLKRDRTNLL